MTLIILLNIAFTLAVFYVFLRVGNEPTVLVGCWFAFTTGELWLLATIKKTRLKGADNLGKGSEPITSGSEEKSGATD